MTLEKTNLVGTWRRVVTEDGTKKLAPALNRLNETLGTKVRHSRIKEWERGTHNRSPSPDIINYMIQEAVPELAGAYGLGTGESEELASLLKIPCC